VSDGKGTKVTAESLDDGKTESRVIKDEYNLVTDGDCYVYHVQAYKNGTHVITIKNVGGAR
jgi:hypothetical protein